MLEKKADYYCPWCLPSSFERRPMVFSRGTIETVPHEFPPQDRFSKTGEPIWSLTCEWCGFNIVVSDEDATRYGWQ